MKKLPFEAQLNDTNTPPQYSLVVTPDSQYLMTPNRSGFRGVTWDLKNNVDSGLKPLQRIPFRTNTRMVVFSADGRFGVAQASNKILVWNGVTGLDVAMFDQSFVNQVAIVPEANVVIASSSREFVAWNWLTGKEVWNTKALPFGGGLVGIPKSKRLAYVALGEIVIRDCVKGEDTQRWSFTGSPPGLTASADGKHLISFGGLNERKVRLWALPPVSAKKP